MNQRNLAELKRQAAKKAGLPDDLAGRLSGGTLEELEADAEELAKAMPVTQTGNSQRATQGAGSTANPAASSGTFTRAQLADPRFYAANKDAIFLALREGRIKE